MLWDSSGAAAVLPAASTRGPRRTHDSSPGWTHSDSPVLAAAAARASVAAEDFAELPPAPVMTRSRRSTSGIAALAGAKGGAGVLGLGKLST